MTPALKASDRVRLEECFKKTLYTKERIQHWEACQAKLNEAPYEAVVTTFDSDGEARNIAAKGPGKILRYTSYHQTVHKEEEQPPSDTGFEHMLVRVANAPPVNSASECCLNDAKKFSYSEVTQEWKKSEFYVSFMESFAWKAFRMADVKSVACFGLGEIKADADRPNTHMIANYLQHVLAVEIRDLLACKQNMDKQDIPVYAQDPKYCTNCKDILTKGLGITIMETNSGFLKVDGATFVVTSAPAVPLRQIVGDLTKDLGGPAGILCQPIDNDGIVAADKIVDMSSPSMYQFGLEAKLKNSLAKIWRAVPVDSSDEESDRTNTVNYGALEKLPASIFPDFAIYLKKRPS